MPYAREAGHSFAAVLRVSCPLLCLWQVETAGDLPDLGNANLRSLRLHARCGDLLAQAMQAQGSRLGSLGSLSSRPRLNGKLRLRLRLPRDITSTCIALLRSLPQQGSHRAERTAVMAVPTGDPASLNPFWWAQDSNALASPSFRVLHPDRGSSSEAIWTVWRYSVTRVL